MRRRKPIKPLELIADNPPAQRGDRRTAKLLSLLDNLKPASDNQHKEVRKK
ncbi:MAG: hypothetical protein NTW21_44170 [Verrucomicrobia bacterium]|nr:hypothetical protein [Verrucomicrobiota bacterium]